MRSSPLEIDQLCIVLGNGPSLRGFDFKRLTGFNCLGMNAAYRYWDQIGWYPKHYCCLDDQLVETHHNEIDRLHREGLVETVFVHGRFYEHHPDRIGQRGFYSLDQVLPHWYKERARHQGWMSLFEHPAFACSDTSKVTTGAYATRFAAFLAYRTIALMGIDLRYVEVLPEARSNGGVALVMERTPEKNPNYFFDGYQLAGDKYNIPNPAVHSLNLHPRSFELVRDDFARNGLPVEIVNTNPKSILSDRDIFPLRAIETLLDVAPLGAVFVPATAREAQDIKENFAIWSHPGYHPLLKGENSFCDLVIVFNRSSCRAVEHEIRRAYDDEGMNRFFRSLQFEFLDLSDEGDVYNRDYSTRVGKLGHKAGPNKQFFESLHRLRKVGKYAFLMETDCVPIRRGWLTQLERLTSQAEPFFILGSAYRGADRLAPIFARHINGNAVYAVGDQDFQSFVQDFWEPRTWDMIASTDRRMAYDCILEALFNTGDRLPDDKTWASLAHKIRYTGFIQNLSGASDIASFSPEQLSLILERSPESFMVHNRAARKSIAAMLGRGLATAGHVTTAPHPDGGGGASEPQPASRLDDQAIPSTPRVLIFDMTLIGNGTATGEIKSNLFANWPKETLLQIFDAGSGHIGIYSSGRVDGRTTALDSPLIAETIRSFRPDVVLYRPVPDAPRIHEVALREIRRLNVPLVTWIMDDWPARLEAENPSLYAELHPDWLELLDRSSIRLSICETMSGAFRERYGMDFVPIANAVDISEWPESRQRSRESVLLRYAGSLAPDMGLLSVYRVALAVDRLSRSGVDICMEIKTRPAWAAQAGAKFNALKNVSITTVAMSAAQYRAWLQESDINLIAYNFDDYSLRYTKYSFANKLPECLASGGALLALGPTGQATIDYLVDWKAAEVVNHDDLDRIEEALRRLVASPEYRASLASRGRALASDRHNIGIERERLRKLLCDVVDGSVPVQRDPHAIVDETEVIAALMADRRGRDHVMIDVGAHFGTSAGYFDKLGWTVHCFEPDANNRAKLVAKFGESPNVSIDPRAVSDKRATGLPFFTTAESTGISGLHSFRDTHIEAARVDATTVAEIVADRRLSKIDFLKIDVEGFDFSVLKGVPWDRVKPDVIEAEFEDAKTLRLGHTYREVCDFLVARGYAVYLSEWHPIVRYGIPHDWRRVIKYPSSLATAEAWGNILAFKTDPGLPAVEKAFADLVTVPKPKVAVAPANAGAPAVVAASVAAKPTATPTQTLSKATPVVMSNADKSRAPAQAPAPSARPASRASADLPLYTRIALWAKGKSPALFAAGQFVGWLLKTARRYPLLVLLYAGMLVGLAVVAIWPSPDFEVLRQAAGIGSITILALGLFGIAVAYARHVARRLTDERHLAQQIEIGNLRRQLQNAEAAANRSINEIKSSVARLSKDETVTARIAGVSNEMSVIAQRLGSRLDASEASSARTMDEARQRLVKAEQQIASIAQSLAATAERVGKAEQQIAGTGQKLTAADAALKVVEEAAKLAKTQAAQAASQAESLVRLVPPNNAIGYQPFNRMLRKADAEVLSTVWSRALSVALDTKTLYYMSDRLCTIEAQLRGRLATSVESMLLRMVVAKGVRKNEIHIAEIGTLFGIGAAIMYDALRPQFENVHLTLIDPLDGYYSQRTPDIQTGQPVDEPTLRANLSRVGATEKDVTIIKLFSTDDEAIRRASERPIDVLIIDGDHSFSGVKADFQNYARFVRIGGFVVFDDYESPDWPDIKRFVDEEVRTCDWLASVGAQFRTAVFRVTGPQSPR